MVFKQPQIKFDFFGCLRETLVILKVLGSFVISSKIVSYPEGSGFLRNVFSLHQNFQETFFNNNHNILVIKCENTFYPLTILGQLDTD